MKLKKMIKNFKEQKEKTKNKTYLYVFELIIYNQFFLIHYLSFVTY